MADDKKEQFETEEEIVVPVVAPVQQVGGLPLSTERPAPIKRFLPDTPPLSERHGMTTEANRFKET